MNMNAILARSRNAVQPTSTMVTCFINVLIFNVNCMASSRNIPARPAMSAMMVSMITAIALAIAGAQVSGLRYCKASAILDHALAVLGSEVCAPGWDVG